ncbi:hypothetical protein G9A89_012202 [Geosiphon pyriformis]|nr:hypothetical protein G9A89_012202 [Geosiphon pyriformis]
MLSSQKIFLREHTIFTSKLGHFFFINSGSKLPLNPLYISSFHVGLFSKSLSTEASTRRSTLDYGPKASKLPTLTYLLAVVPVITFLLGTWQVQRLRWKVGLIEDAQERLSKPPIKLPKNLNPKVIDELFYRRVQTTGKFHHDQEILLGPRPRNNKPGYIVITPLEQENGVTVLVKRGWISEDKTDPATRSNHETDDIVKVEGLVKKGDKKTWFTPVNKPEKKQWIWTDLKAMGKHTGAQPVLIEESLGTSPYLINKLIDEGVPVGKIPQVDYTNTHLEYAITWYSLSFATTLMFIMLVKKPRSGHVRRQAMRG